MSFSFYPISPFILQKIIWIPTRLILKFFGHLEVTGLDNLRYLERGVIFAMNHGSEMDPILLPASLPMFSRFAPMFYVSREKSFYKNSGWRKLFYGGFFFKAWGAYPVFTGLKNYEQSLVNHRAILNDKNSICIFPEGHKSRDGYLSKAKGGTSYLSYSTGKPVVPVGIEGNYGIKAKNFYARKIRIRLNFGTPIYPSEIFTESLKPEITPESDNFIKASQLILNKIGLLAHNTNTPFTELANSSTKSPASTEHFSVT